MEQDKSVEEEKVRGLMNPRYKLIAGYPKNALSIGRIITQSDGYWFDIGDGRITDEKYISTFPHLFKKLEWYEERKPEDMPKYLKFDEDRNSVGYINNEAEPDIHKVKIHFRSSIDLHWRYSDSKCFISEWHCSQYSYTAFVPVSEQEYLTYINKNS